MKLKISVRDFNEDHNLFIKSKKKIMRWLKTRVAGF